MEADSSDVIGHGLEAAKLALEYVGAIVADPANATPEEGRAVAVAICACIACLNSKLLKSCPPQVYAETQDLILRLMETGAQGIVKRTEQNATDTTEEA